MCSKCGQESDDLLDITEMLSRFDWFKLFRTNNLTPRHTAGVVRDEG